MYIMPRPSCLMTSKAAARSLHISQSAQLSGAGRRPGPGEGAGGPLSSARHLAAAWCCGFSGRLPELAFSLCLCPVARATCPWLAERGIGGGVRRTSPPLTSRAVRRSCPCLCCVGSARLPGWQSSSCLCLPLGLASSRLRRFMRTRRHSRLTACPCRGCLQ